MRIVDSAPPRLRTTYQVDRAIPVTLAFGKKEPAGFTTFRVLVDALGRAVVYAVRSSGYEAMLTPGSQRAVLDVLRSLVPTATTEEGADD